jgi:Methylase of chemotaxis methyl-accepting proteins
VSTPRPALPTVGEAESLEVDFLVRVLRERYGHDFSGYQMASLRRRVTALVRRLEMPDAATLGGRLLRDPDLLAPVLEGISVPVSDMFRDPFVFAALREQVFPLLASHPRINVWQAGCAHGEEVYSLAILLDEAGLYERSQIYATDFSEAALQRARDGIYPARQARAWAENYLAAGGRGSLSDYYHARYEHLKLDEGLRRNISFLNHNLVGDRAFQECQLILCRNVLIYFTDALQDRVLDLLCDSLGRGGFLCIGTQENIDFTVAVRRLRAIEPAAARIYRLRP